MPEPGKDPHTGESGGNWAGAIAGWFSGGAAGGVIGGLLGGPWGAIGGAAAGEVAGAYYGYHSKEFPRNIARTAVYGLTFGTLREALEHELDRGTAASGLNPISRGGWNDGTIRLLSQRLKMPATEVRKHCDGCHKKIATRWNKMAPLTKGPPAVQRRGPGHSGAIRLALDIREYVAKVDPILVKRGHSAASRRRFWRQASPLKYPDRFIRAGAAAWKG